MMRYLSWSAVSGTEFPTWINTSSPATRSLTIEIAALPVASSMQTAEQSEPR